MSYGMFLLHAKRNDFYHQRHNPSIFFTKQLHYKWGPLIWLPIIHPAERIIYCSPELLPIYTYSSLFMLVHLMAIVFFFHNGG